MVSQIDMRGEVTINSQIYVRPRSAGNLAVHRELADDIAMTVDALDAYGARPSQPPRWLK